ncbi:hypothetical protein [Pseudoalteromonas sp. MMG012]|uniref:hypothetical protein n=1 Tax=Pseudoalteromonas sp. MMG012 TaxID=2822686 RepID=UPI001B3A61B2|nr:hypothetical protein [Pseudoalteromonas sp. MMG012]MBQ4852593.1 hypothetical protein [Pseudoalteromonas sp. MMG012]
MLKMINTALARYMIAFVFGYDFLNFKPDTVKEPLMNLSTAINQQTDPALEDIEAIDCVINLSSQIPVPGIQKIIKPLNAIVKMFKPSSTKQIKEELTQINQKMSSIYGLVQEALTEDDVKVLMRSNISLFVQIQDVELALKTPVWTQILKQYGEMVTNFTDAAQHVNDFLKHYEKVNINADGYLIQYIGGFANTMCQFYSMYALLQHTSNILMEKNTQNKQSRRESITERLTNEQKIVIDCVTEFINQALGKDTDIFNFKYPSWCKNIFKQEAVKISSLDGREMKYPRDSKNEHICLSESYVTGPVCREFKISFVDIENPHGVWELTLQSNNTAGCNIITDEDRMKGNVIQYLYTDREERFIIKYDGTSIIIVCSEHDSRYSAHLGAEPHVARNVLMTDSSYKWNIISLE